MVWVITGWIGFMVLMVGITLVFGRRAGQKTTELMRGMAGRTGLTFHQGSPVLGIFARIPELNGEQNGRLIRVYQYTTGSGKNSTNWSAVKMGRVAGTALAIKLGREGFGSKVRSWFGAKEIEVSDSFFDRNWFIETNDPDFLRAALVREVRSALESTQKAEKPIGRYELKEGEVSYTEQGSLTKPDRIERLERAITAGHRLLDIAEVHAANGGQVPGK